MELRMKRYIIFFISLFCIFNVFPNAFAHPTQSQIITVPIKGDTIPVQVMVTVANANYIETITICNISASTIPLNNIEFDFNYDVSMPTNIWGLPWAAWKVLSQTNTAVILQGGTPYTPPLLPDPNCTTPLTIQFNAPPDAPAPKGPFIFKSEGGQPPGAGTLVITQADAPDNNVPLPVVSISGPSAPQQQTVAWGETWQIQNLLPGTYSISSSPTDNKTNYYQAKTINVNVEDQKTTQQTITYNAVPTGEIKINLIQAPYVQEPLAFTGKIYNFNETVNIGSSLILPEDTYTVTSLVPGYNALITPNPITIPTDTTLNVTYTINQNPAGPYTTSGGQILDKNNNPVTFKGVAWFGFNTGNHLVHGLWQADFDTMVRQIKTAGFNAVRLPFQFDFILDSSIKPSGITTFCNGKPCNLNVPQDSALHALQWVVQKFTDNGLYVLLDDHYEDDTYVRNQDQWILGWQKVAQLFATNPSVGYDLYNEPDSHNLTWDGNTNATSWSDGLHAAMSAIFKIDHHKLFFIEGTAQGALKSNWGDGFAADDAMTQQCSKVSATRKIFLRNYSLNLIFVKWSSLPMFMGQMVLIMLDQIIQIKRQLMLIGHDYMAIFLRISSG